MDVGDRVEDEDGRTGMVTAFYEDTSVCSDPTCCTPIDRAEVQWDDTGEVTSEAAQLLTLL